MGKAYVQVYDKLRAMIEEGTFPVGSPLPSEPKLSKMLETSRMTLRQALELLHEDGLLKKVKGSGNYVQMRDASEPPALNKMGNPIDKCLTEKYDHIENEFWFEESNDYGREIFGNTVKEYVSSYQYYYCGKKLLAYTYSAVRVDILERLGLDFHDEDTRLSFLLRGIYEEAKRSHIEIQMDLNTVCLWPVPLKEEDRVSFMLEKIYGNNYELMACNKHYFMEDMCRITIESE